jgi:predicted metal-dependent hydrolase
MRSLVLGGFTHTATVWREAHHRVGGRSSVRAMAPPAGLAYRLRVSPRAECVHLEMSYRGLVVVVPAGFDETRIPEVLEARRDWIRRSHRRLADRIASPPSPLRPDRFELPAIGRSWSVEYRQTEGERVAGRERPGGRLLVHGNIADDVAVAEALRRWFSRKARDHLAPWLLSLAHEYHLDVAGVAIRSQRTRWASCSSRRTINLNVHLLFLPPALARYVLLHELAHLEEMNHGPGYWAVLESLEPNYRALARELRRFTPDTERPAFDLGALVPGS